MTIKTRLILVLGVMFSVFGIATGVTVVNLNAEIPLLKTSVKTADQVSQSSIPLLETIKDIQRDVIEVQLWISDISATRGLNGENDGFDKAKASAAQFAADVVRARKLAQRMNMPQVLDALKSVETAFVPYYKTGIALGKVYVAQGPAAGNQMIGSFDAVAETMGNNINALVSKVNVSTDYEVLGLVNGVRRVQGSMSELERLNLMLAGVGLAVALASAVYLFRFLHRSINNLMKDINSIQDHNWDATACLDGERKDEFGAVSRALSQTRRLLGEAEESETARKLAEERAVEEQKEQRLAMAQRFETTVGAVVEGVSAAAGKMEVSAQSVSTTAGQTNSQATSVATAAEQASLNVQTVASASEELSSSIDEISRQVAQSAQVAGAAVTEVEGANAKVQGLAAAAQKIGEVVALITDIADQTNLLALNATIEAARAGEAGKGFAVVASEVKNLANQTARATEEISTQIGGIQNATEEAVAAIGSIGGTISQISEISSAISAAVEEQGAATQEIARNVEEAANGTAEVSSNIVQVTQAADDTGRSADAILHEASEMSRQSDRLRDEANAFLQTIRAA